MLSLSVAVQGIWVTPFGYGASSASVGSSLLTPTSETTLPSSVAVATPGLRSATQDPRAGVMLNACLLVDVAGGAVRTVVSFETVRTGGCGGVNRTASFVSEKKFARRGLVMPLIGFVTLSKAAAGPSAFSIPCVMRLLLFVTFSVLV